MINHPFHRIFRGETIRLLGVPLWKNPLEALGVPTGAALAALAVEAGGVRCLGGAGWVNPAGTGGGA